MSEKLVDEIVALEWKAFDEVKNEGGRAGCQDDWNTFQIMRKSQYLTWTDEMLQQYKADFIDSGARGWNMVTEKYARMMESNAKEQYEAIKNQLPPISEEKKQLIEIVVAIQVKWMEEFRKEYPHLGMNGRALRTEQDTEYATSYETYLRGEISTYSDKMLCLYALYIMKLYKEGKNLAKVIMMLTTAYYGYASIDAAENRLKYSQAAKIIADKYLQGIGWNRLE